MAEFSRNRLFRVTGLELVLSPNPVPEAPSISPKTPVWSGIPSPYAGYGGIFGEPVALGSEPYAVAIPTPPYQPPGPSGPTDWHELVQHQETVILSEMLEAMVRNGVTSAEV